MAQEDVDRKTKHPCKSVPHPDLSNLLPRLKMLDNDAWAEVVEAYGFCLKKYMVWSLNNPFLAAAYLDDLEEDVWVTAIREIGGFEPRQEGSLYGWLITIAENRVKALIKSVARRSKREAISLDDEGTDEESLSSLANLNLSTHEGELQARDFFATFAVAVKELGLSPRDQEIISRSAFQNQTAREIFEEMIGRYPSITQDGISKAIQRTKERIKALRENKEDLYKDLFHGFIWIESEEEDSNDGEITQ